MVKRDLNEDEEIDYGIEKNRFEQELKAMIANIDSIEQHRLPQRAYHIIRLAIRDLILPPGETILSREIGEVLQMSRTPVREALVRLETEGVIRLIPRRGFIVEPIEKEDLKEVYEIISTLDGLGAELATARLGDNEINKLELIIQQQEEALDLGDLKSWAISDDLFHAAIIKYAENNRLSTVIDSYSDQTYRARLFTINFRPIPFNSIIEHKAIISCMRANDGKAASVIMQSHRNRAQREILDALDEIKKMENK